MAAEVKHKKSEAKSKEANAAREPRYSKDLLIQMYKDMCLYRRFEERANQAYVKQKFSGFLHLHIGQEGLCEGVQRALRDSDYVISGYRSHTQAIAKGIPPRQVMAELFGKLGGASRGKGGSMHMFSKDRRFLGGHGIVGGQVPLATGVGFAIRYRDQDDICVCYLGDAATNQGQFFEALNMAATWNLPVLFVIENNKYGMGTDIRRTTSVDHLWKRALAFDMDHGDVDGMNVLHVYDKVSEIVEAMRQSKRPYLLEAHTYRYRGHSISDPGTYRTKEEVEEYRKLDPIVQLGAYLEQKGVASEQELKAWDDEAKAEVEKAEAWADESPEPPLEDVWTDVYVP